MSLLKILLSRKILQPIVVTFAFVSFLLSCVEDPKIQISATNQQVSAKLYLADMGTPWGMTWLPNGDMLITMREGKLLLLQQGIKQEEKHENATTESITGLPELAVAGQGGLLDIILHPKYKKNGWIYLSYSKADKNGNTNIAIMRAKLQGLTLTDQQEIYVAQAYTDKGQHFAGRMAFDQHDYLYFSIGDRGQRDINPQDISRDGGKIYRLHDDGSIPQDNPFVNKVASKKAIYSYGHRNPQGMEKHPITGDIWIHEHGPRGGDEVNIIGKGKNYGWPVISYGINYIGTKFTELTEKEGMEQPIWYWDPSIAPSGITFVTSNKYPQWQGNLLVGSLKFGYVVMLTLNGNKVVKQAIVQDKLNRVRNIKQAPDGYIYVGVDGEGIYRLVPEE